MKALDDSLVRTSRQRDHGQKPTFVAHPHDPSIIDFIIDYLSNSPEDVRELARGSLFFEQASWLWATSTESSPRASRTTLREIQAALQRAYSSPGITTVTVAMGSGSFSHRPAGTRDLEHRLLLLLEVARSDADFRAWWSKAFADRVPRWTQGEGEPESLLKLLGALSDEDDVDTHAAAIAAKRVVTGGYDYVQGLEWLHQLRSKFPDAFEADEWNEHVADFETWLHDDLSSSAEDMSDTGELHFVDRVADLFGLTIDEAERDGRIDPDPDYDASASGRDVVREQREIEAIFTKLAD
jgi:hypothetical protein